MTTPATWLPPITVSTDPRHQYFLRATYEGGHVRSDDRITKVGASIVDPREEPWRLVAIGANHVPHTVDVEDDELTARLQDRSWKTTAMTHAEPTAIAIARERGYDLKGFVMYMPWVPCTPCAEAIEKAGIAKLITHEAMILKTPERWWESTAQGVLNLQRNGIDVEMYRGTIGGVVSVFNGEVWFP